MSEPIIRLEKITVCGVCGASEKLHENWRSGHTFDPVERTFRVSYFEGHREEVMPMEQLQTELAGYVGSPEFSNHRNVTPTTAPMLTDAILISHWLLANGYLSERITKGGS